MTSDWLRERNDIERDSIYKKIISASLKKLNKRFNNNKEMIAFIIIIIWNERAKYT